MGIVPGLVIGSNSRSSFGLFDDVLAERGFEAVGVRQGARAVRGTASGSTYETAWTTFPLC